MCGKYANRGRSHKPGAGGCGLGVGVSIDQRRDVANATIEKIHFSIRATATLSCMGCDYSLRQSSTLYFLSFFVFRARQARKTKNKAGTHLAAAGTYQLIADHRVTRVNQSNCYVHTSMLMRCPHQCPRRVVSPSRGAQPLPFLFGVAELQRVQARVQPILGDQLVVRT
jgi:hypothetical protein